VSWQELLSTSDEERVLAWTGGRKITDGRRTWKIRGRLPQEHGWYTFNIDGGRRASLASPTPADPPFDCDDGLRVVKGYLVGNRMIRDDVPLVLDPNQIVRQTSLVHFVELGLEPFTRAATVEEDGRLLFIRTEFPLGPEIEALEAYEDRKTSLDGIPGVTPALDLAFRWMTFQREREEERARAQEQRRREEEALRQREAAEQERLRRQEEAIRSLGNRRALATRDFRSAAEAALRLSGSTLLDVRTTRCPEERVVRFRFRGRRFECVVNAGTLRVIDSGICLTDEVTDERGDSYLTLESLPGVIGQAIDQGVLHIYRRA
jgi:hypothetical protein